MLVVRILATALLLGLVPSPAGAFHDSPGVRAGMLRATDLILNLDLELARAECHKLLALPKGEAAGRFCLALVAVAWSEEKDDPAPELARFRRELPGAVAAAEALAAAEPGDADVRLLLGLVHGTRAIVEGESHRYLEAVRAVRQAHHEFGEALRLDPGMVDAYYGLGLYAYSVARLPALVRPLVAAVLPPGDAERGLRDLRRVAEQGHFLRMTAKMALLRLYAGPERRYAEAVELGRELLRRYPGNPEVYFATAHAASESGRFSEAMDIARAVSRQIAAGHPRFPAELSPRYYQLVGKLYMDHGEPSMAVSFFDRALESATPPRYRWVTAWAWVRSGMAHDLLGEREEAVRRYRQTLAVQADGLAAELARRYLDTPYRMPAAS